MFFELRKFKNICYHGKCMLMENGNIKSYSLHAYTQSMDNYINTLPLDGILPTYIVKYIRCKAPPFWHDHMYVKMESNMLSQWHIFFYARNCPYVRHCPKSTAIFISVHLTTLSSRISTRITYYLEVTKYGHRYDQQVTWTWIFTTEQRYTLRISTTVYFSSHHAPFFSDAIHRLISDNWAACECYHALHLHSMDTGRGNFTMLTANTNGGILDEFFILCGSGTDKKCIAKYRDRDNWKMK